MNPIIMALFSLAGCIETSNVDHNKIQKDLEQEMSDLVSRITQNKCVLVDPKPTSHKNNIDLYCQSDQKDSYIPYKKTYPNKDVTKQISVNCEQGTIEIRYYSSPFSGFIGRWYANAKAIPLSTENRSSQAATAASQMIELLCPDFSPADNDGWETFVDVTRRAW